MTKPAHLPLELSCIYKTMNREMQPVSLSKYGAISIYIYTEIHKSLEQKEIYDHDGRRHGETKG